jgi:hypothetical protein
MTMAPEYSALHEAVDLLSPRQAKDLFRSIERMLRLENTRHHGDTQAADTANSVTSLSGSFHYQGPPVSLADMEVGIVAGATSSMS